MLVLCQNVIAEIASFSVPIEATLTVAASTTAATSAAPTIARAADDGGRGHGSLAKAVCEASWVGVGARHLVCACVCACVKVNVEANWNVRESMERSLCEMRDVL